MDFFFESYMIPCAISILSGSKLKSFYFLNNNNNKKSHKRRVKERLHKAMVVSEYLQTLKWEGDGIVEAKILVCE